MATNYRIYKQFAPALEVNGDPTWAQRQVWVAKLNSQDTIDEYDTEAEASAKAAELADADPTERIYEVRTVEV